MEAQVPLGGMCGDLGRMSNACLGGARFTGTLSFLFVLSLSWQSQFLSLKCWLWELLPICQQQKEGVAHHKAWTTTPICHEDGMEFAAAHNRTSSPRPAPHSPPCTSPDKGQLIFCEGSLLRLV